MMVDLLFIYLFICKICFNKMMKVLIFFLFIILIVNKFFRIKTLQAIKEKLLKLTASLDFYVFVYPCCLTA